MALVLSEEQQMLKDAAAGFLAQRATVSHLRELRDSADKTGYSSDVWQEMVAMGWSSIAIPEEHGGLGYGYTGLGLVLEQAGRNLSASPLQSTVLIAATVIAELASPSQRAELLPPIASGEKLVSLALQETGHHSPAQTALTAVADGDNAYRLSGSKLLVLDAASADTFIVVARTAAAAGETAGLSVFLVDADTPGLTIEPRDMVDSRSAGALICREVRVPAAHRLGAEGEAWNGLERALDIANIGLAAELLGVASEAFDRTLAYVKERQQFGRAIGSFQGLQHRLAELFAELELARSIVLKALQAIDASDPQLPLLASAAKAKLCEVAQRATNEAIQMHGGIGMTDEHEIGWFIKRARVVQHCFGGYDYHMDRFARLSGF